MNQFRRSEKFLLFGAILIFIVKIFLLFGFPFTGDEAYFVQWGHDLSAGYYDHTPMVGWINHLMSQGIDDFRFFRLFSLATTLAVAFFIYKAASDPGRGKIAAFIWWVSPSSLFLVPMLNDTCLVFFGVISYYFFDRWKKDERHLWGVLCGFFLGLSFLSKYLAVVIGVGYVVSLLMAHRRRLPGFLLLLTAGVLPSVVWNLLWNHQNCWNNIMFNLLNRQITQGEGRPDLYIVSLMLLLSPWMVVAIIKVWSLRAKMSMSWLWLAFAPLGLFAVMSLKRVVGIHWLLVFVIPSYVAISYLPYSYLKRLSKLSMIYGLILGGAAFFVTKYADELIERYNLATTQLQRNAYLYSVHPRELCQALDSMVPGGFELVVTGYPPSAIFEHICHKKLTTLFATGVYGRQCDTRNDIAPLAGKDLALYIDSGVADRYGAFFDSFEVVNKSYQGTQLTLVLGKGFHFEKYRDEVLRVIAESYYSPPSWLPKGRCGFIDRYFPDGIDKVSHPELDQPLEL